LQQKKHHSGTHLGSGYQVNDVFSHQSIVEIQVAAEPWSEGLLQNKLTPSKNQESKGLIFLFHEVDTFAENEI
jgi:hypothetical protein